MKLKRMERIDRKSYIIYPEDKHKIYWVMFITIILIITCIILPARLAFFKHTESEEKARNWMIINICLDFFFLVDMIIVFNTAFYDDYMTIVDDRGSIAKSYL